jgi:hypothetical protein
LFFLPRDTDKKFGALGGKEGGWVYYHACMIGKVPSLIAVFISGRNLKGNLVWWFFRLFCLQHIAAPQCSLFLLNSVTVPVPRSWSGAKCVSFQGKDKNGLCFESNMLRV